MVNWEFFDNQTPRSTCGLVDRLRAGEAVRPTRGADQVVDFRAMSRVLAGFEDGHADEGPGAGDATLAKRLEEVCPVDIFSSEAGRVTIVEANLDECVLCRLCLDAAPDGAVRIVKRYDGDTALS